MATMPLEETTDPAVTAHTGTQQPVVSPVAAQLAVAVIKPWQIAAAVLAVVLSVLGFMWQMQAGLGGIRQEVAEIRTLQIEIVQRLSRIEGFLGIGLPPDAAEHAPGAHLRDSMRVEELGAAAPYLGNHTSTAQLSLGEAHKYAWLESYPRLRSRQRSGL